MNLAQNVVMHMHEGDFPPLATPLIERVYETGNIIVTRIPCARFGHVVRIDIKP